MTQDDRMETITDPAAIRASDEPDERGDFPCCTTPAPASGVGLDLDAIEAAALANDGWWSVPAFALVAEVRRLTRLGQCDLDLLMRAEAAEAEVVTLRAQVNGLHEELLRDDPDVVTLRASVAALQVAVSHSAESCADGPCEFHETVARAESAEAEVRRLTEESERLKRGGTELGRILDRALMMALDASGCHDVIEEDGDGDWEVVWETLAGLRPRAESAEVEVVTLRARLAAVEALADQWADRKRSDGMSGNAWIGLTLSGVAADLRAALATTGEGQ